MPKITTYYFTGPVLFANVFEENIREGGEFDSDGGQWAIQVGLNEEDWEEVESWSHLYNAKTVKSLTKKGKEIPDGMDPDRFYINFKRNRKLFNKEGECYKELDAPAVLDSEGNPWSFDDDGYIGNGSVCTVKVEVLTGTNARGQEYKKATLVGLRVEEHVPWEGVEYERETVNNTGGLPF